MVEIFDPTQFQLQAMAGCFKLIHKGSWHHQGHPVQLLRGANVVVVSGSVPEAEKHPRKSLCPISTSGSQRLLELAVLKLYHPIALGMVGRGGVDQGTQSFHGEGEDATRKLKSMVCYQVSRYSEARDPAVDEALGDGVGINVGDQDCFQPA